MVWHRKKGVLLVKIFSEPPIKSLLVVLLAAVYYLVSSGLVLWPDCGQCHIYRPAVSPASVLGRNFIPWCVWIGTMVSLLNIRIHSSLFYGLGIYSLWLTDMTFQKRCSKQIRSWRLPFTVPFPQYVGQILANWLLFVKTLTFMQIFKSEIEFWYQFG